MVTAYPLPEHRTKDFLSTMLLIMSEPELHNEVYLALGYEGDKGTSFYSQNGSQMNIIFESNSNYDNNLTDPKNVNYYTNIMTFDQTMSGVEHTVQMHLRQDLNSTTTISFMTMKKSHNVTNYEYVGNVFVNQMSITPAHIGTNPKPLPDILK